MRTIGAMACVAAILGSGLLGATPSLAQLLSFDGTCTVAAGKTGGQAYATLKCQKSGVAGDYVIRNTEWERDDAEAYRKLASLSGRRFTCKFTQSGRSTKDDTAFTHYKLSNCR